MNAILTVLSSVLSILCARCCLGNVNAAGSAGGKAIHEAGIALNIVKIADEAAVENGLKRITRLVLEVGVFSGVEPEALLFAFKALGKGTVLESAEVEILKPPLVLYCPQCENEYAAYPADLRCPVCESEDYEIIQGKELTIKSIIGEVEDGQENGTGD